MEQQDTGGDEIINKRYYSIGEVSVRLNVNASLIRFWVKEFSRFFKIQKNRKGNRIFTVKDIEKLEYIHYLVKDQKLTLKGVAKVISSQNDKEKQNPVFTLFKVRNFLEQIRNEL